MIPSIRKGTTKSQSDYAKYVNESQDRMVKVINAIHESRRKKNTDDLKALINQALKEIEQIKASLQLDKASEDMYQAAKNKAGIH